MASTADQPIKSSSNLKKLKGLNLTESKKKLMETSIFRKLVNVQNFRESSGTLVFSLATCLKVTGKEMETGKITFEFKNSTFSFCVKEVEQVLGMENTGISVSEYVKAFEEKDFKKYIPDFLECFKLDSINSLSSKVLKDKLRTMEINNDNDKAFFQKIMHVFSIDQMLLPSTNYQVVSPKYIYLVDAPEMINRCNWPQAVFEGLFNALVGTQNFLKSKSKKQHVFCGALPILEVLFISIW